MGKISFGSLMLGTILKGTIDLFQIFVFGAAATMAMFALGVLFVFIGKE